MKKIILIFLFTLFLPQLSYSTDCVAEKYYYTFYYHSKKYEFVQQKSQWISAAKCANERGGYPIIIDNKEENDAIANYLANEFKDKDGNSIVDGYSTTNHLLWIGGSVFKNIWSWDKKNYQDTFREFYHGTNYGYALNNSYVNWGSVKKIQYFPKEAWFFNAVSMTLRPYYDSTSKRILSSAGQWIGQSFEEFNYYVIEYDCKDTLYEASEFTSCYGESIIFAGDTIRESGIYYDTTQTYGYCDSIHTLTVDITNLDRDIAFDGKKITSSEQNADEYKWYNCVTETVIDNTQNTYSPKETGKYKVVITKNDCDFTSECYEVCFPTKNRLDTLKCKDDPIIINGVEYATQGFYTQDLKQVGFECDSTLDIDIKDVRMDFRIREFKDTLISYELQAEYQWYNCEGDMLIADATKKEYVPTEDGDYKVEITKQGCIDYSDCFKYTTTTNSVKDIQDSENIRLDETNRMILFSNLNYDQIELMDINSKTIYKSDKLTQSISIETLPTGVYFLKIVKGNEVEMFKFMVVG